MKKRERIQMLEAQLAMSADDRLKAAYQEIDELKQRIENLERAVDPDLKAIATLLDEDLLVYLRRIAEGGWTMTERAANYEEAAYELRIQADEFQAECDEILAIREKRDEARADKGESDDTSDNAE